MRTRTGIRARNAILGGFLADAAAIGLHWYYDVAEVTRRGGAAPEFQPPERNPYHAHRRAGEPTHYGDHARVMLESLVASGGLDTEDYRRRMLERFGAPGYDGYLDRATRGLLATGKGAHDNQAGCLAKLPPLVARFLDDPELDERLEEAIRVTHDHDEAVDFGLAAAHALRAAILGASPGGAVAAVVERGGSPAEGARAALKAGPDPIAFAATRGQDSHVPHAVPVALHAALHGPDFKSVVRACIFSGGESAGRLWLAGSIRGATDGLPPDWLARLAARTPLEELVDRLLAACPAV